MLLLLCWFVCLSRCVSYFDFGLRCAAGTTTTPDGSPIGAASGGEGRAKLKLDASHAGKPRSIAEGRRERVWARRERERAKLVSGVALAFACSCSCGRGVRVWCGGCVAWRLRRCSARLAGRAFQTGEPARASSEIAAIPTNMLPSALVYTWVWLSLSLLVPLDCRSFESVGFFFAHDRPTPPPQCISGERVASACVSVCCDCRACVCSISLTCAVCVFVCAPPLLSCSALLCACARTQSTDRPPRPSGPEPSRNEHNTHTKEAHETTTHRCAHSLRTSMALSPLARDGMAPRPHTARISAMPLLAMAATLLLLLCCSPSLAADSSTSLQLSPPRVDLMLFTSFVQDNFMQRAILLYSLYRSTSEVNIQTAYKAATATANSVSNGFTAMKNAEADFAVLPAVATASTVSNHVQST